MTQIGHRIGTGCCPRQERSSQQRSADLPAHPGRFFIAVSIVMKRRVIKRQLLLISTVFVIGSGLMLGCAGKNQRTGDSWTSPAQHAVSQVQWLKSRAGQLTPEELQLLQQVPWRGAGNGDLDRQKIFDLTQDGKAPVNRITQRRVLGRPRVMDAARKVLRAELEQQRPAVPAAAEPENKVNNIETNSRGTEQIPATTGEPGEDGGRR